jgi:hypothetical protein
MKPTRKTFITTIATGVAAVALRPSVLLGGSAEPMDAHAFQELVGTTLRFRSFDRRDAADLVLVEFTEKPSHARTRQFTLTFGAPGGDRLREGTYTVDSPRGGTFEIFVIPAGADAKGQPLYRADFNILVEAAVSPTTVKPRR